MPKLAHRAYWTAFLAMHVIGQARYPYASPECIARDRDRNLRRMVAYAYRYVPYYRDLFARLGLTPEDVQTFDDLRQLPLISVRDLQRDPQVFRSTAIPQEELLALTSGGSTGSPHTVWHEAHSIYTNMVLAERERSMLQRILGRGMRYRTMNVLGMRGHAQKVRTAARVGALWPRWLTLHRASLPSDLGLDELARRLDSLRPDLVEGYGSAVARLFVHLDAQDAPFHHPRVVHYHADMLPTAVRNLLVTKYGIPVFSGYQAVEALRPAWECEAHQGYHVNADYYPMRIVDAAGEDVAPGETGEVVVSNLANRATVLLNYRMGDMAQRLDAPCPCGRHLPRIGFVAGRSADALLALDGRLVHYTLVAPAIAHHRGVWQYQIVQEARDRLVIRLRAAADCDREGILRETTAVVQQVLGAGMAIEMRFVDEIPRTAAGKVRSVINLALPNT